MRIASLNVNSIVKHIDEMRILLESKSTDILLINESKIDDTVLDNEIHISGYNIIRNDRNRNGGGVIMYLKEGLQSVLRIGSAHNKGGPLNINIVQISHFSNSF